MRKSTKLLFQQCLSRDLLFGKFQQYFEMFRNIFPKARSKTISAQPPVGY